MLQHQYLMWKNRNLLQSISLSLIILSINSILDSEINNDSEENTMMIEFLNGEREFFVGNNEDCLFQIVREKLGNDTEDLLEICIGDSKAEMKMCL